MKLWKAILLTMVIICILFVIGFYLRDAATTIFSLIDLFTVCWIYSDLKKLNINQYKTKLPHTPLTFCILFLGAPYVFFPAYLALKWRIKNGLQPLWKEAISTSKPV